MCGRIAALVIEEMDIDIDDNHTRWLGRLGDDLEARRQCGRQFDNFTTLSHTLGQWYNESWIEGWRDDGRVFEMPDGSWWSGISPLTKVRVVS